MLIVATMAFASCQKSEGYFNPDRKINKIYESSETTFTIAGQTTNTTVDKHVSESWTWDGNKLKKIDYYNDNGELENTDVFTYDGDVITKIEWDEQSHVEFVYDKKVLKAIKMYNEDTLYTETIITQRDGKKITELVAYVFANHPSNSKFARANQTALRLLLPELAAKDIAQQMGVMRAAKSKTDTNEINPIRLFWEGDNITKMVMTSNAADIQIEQFYAYDNKINPYRSFVNYLCGPNTINDWGSSNNPVYDSTSMTGEQTLNYGLSYSYEYDGEWPVKRIYTSEIIDPIITHSTKQYVYYEYKD